MICVCARVCVWLCLSSVGEFEVRFLPQSESSPLLLLTEMLSFNCAAPPHPPPTPTTHSPFFTSVTNAHLCTVCTRNKPCPCVCFVIKPDRPDESERHEGPCRTGRERCWGPATPGECCLIFQQLQYQTVKCLSAAELAGLVSLPVILSKRPQRMFIYIMQHLLAVNQIYPSCWGTLVKRVKLMFSTSCEPNCRLCTVKQSYFVLLL